MRVLIVVALLTANLFGQESIGGPVQIKGPVQTGSSTFSVAVPDQTCANEAAGSPVTCALGFIQPGDGIACGWGQRSFGTPGGGVSDNLNGAWAFPKGGAVLTGTYNSNTGYLENVWSETNSLGGYATVTITTSGSTSVLTVHCTAYRNIKLSAAVDGSAAIFNPTNGTGITSTNPNAGTAVAPSNNGEAIFGLMGNVNGTSATQGAGYTIGTQKGAGTFWDISQYRIQTTATSDNAPWTAASDTWIAMMVAFLSLSGTSGGVNPYTGIWTDGHGNTNGTAVTTTNLNSASYQSTNSNWTNCANITTMDWSTGLSIPNYRNPIWINGSSHTGSTNIGLTHANSATTESCQLQVYTNPTLGGTSELDIDQQIQGYTNNVNGDFCDTARIADSVSGDTQTIEWFYDTSVFSGPAVRMEDNSGTTHYSVGIALPNFTDWYRMRLQLDTTELTLTLTAAANASGGNTVYTGTITGGSNNGLVGKWFTVSGFTNTGNNNNVPAGSPASTFANGFQVIASTATTLTLANPSGVAETHAGSAVVDHTMQVYDATTNTFVGTDSSPSQNVGSSSGWVTANIGGQGSCGMTQSGSITNYGYFGVNPLVTPGTYLPQ